MNNQEMLEKLINGKNAVETVKINVDDIEAEFEIRPLTSGELSKLQAIEKQGFKMTVSMSGQGKRQSVQTNDLDINVGEFNEYQAEAMYTAIALSCDLDKEQIKEMPVGVPEALFDEIIRISSLEDSDLTVVKTFRKKE